jgi:calcineurin-like phosphoesterase family protein
MYKFKKITSSGRIAFGSDFHLEHKQPFIWEPRGFKSEIEHRNFCMEGLMSLNSDDILVYLGDFSLNSTIESTKHLLSLIPCRVYYIWGNHESYVGGIFKELNPNGSETYPCEWNNITFLGKGQNFSINGQNLYVSHFPHLVWDYM